MAIRKIREVGEFGDSVLRKPCKEVKEITPRVQDLINDMFDTLYEADGVGLAAPQVGILKRIAVINPKVLETSGEQTGYEGCLSVPGKTGRVTRPNYAKILAYNENMEPFEIEGTELLARAMLHELDHLEGHIYVEKVEGPLQDVEDVEDEE